MIMSRLFQIILHTVGTASFCYSFAILSSYSRFEKFILEFTHLTIVGLLFSLAAFTFGLLYDIFNSSRVLSFIKTLFMVVTVPLEGLISILYWPIIIYDESLLLASGHPRLPILIDMGFHLIPAVCLWIDFLFFMKEFKKSQNHIFYILLFAFSYCGWIQFWFFQYGTWPYPLLAELETQHRIGCYIGCFVLCTAIYHIGAFAHSFFNKSSNVLKNSSKLIKNLEISGQEKIH